MIKRKGIILAGGSGTRLYPLTIGVSKQLLPVYDKPMIYYPLSILMLANIKDFLFITNSEHQSQYKKLFGDGSLFGINIEYAIQENNGGIAEGLILAEDFLDSSPSLLILGDS